MFDNIVSSVQKKDKGNTVADTLTVQFLLSLLGVFMLLLPYFCSCLTFTAAY